MEEEVKHVITEGTLEEIREKLSASTPPETVGLAVVDPPEVVEEIKPETVVAPVVESFDRVKWLSETFETDVADENEFLSSLKDRNAKYDEVVKAAETYRAENEVLKEGIDLNGVFANDKVRIYNEVWKKHPDYDPSIVSQIAFSDLGEMTPMQILTFQALLNDPKHEVYDDNAEANADILAQWTEKGYDPDLPLNDQDPKVKTALKRAKKEAVENIERLKAEIKPLEKVDLTAKVAEKQRIEKENYDRLNPIVKNDIKRVEDSLKTLDFFETVKDGDKDKQVPLFSYNLLNFAESKKVKEILSASIDHISKTASQWDRNMAEKAKVALSEALLKDQLWDNRNQIMKAAKDEWRAQWEAEEHAKNHNPADLNTNQRPVTDQAKISEKIAKAKSDFDKMMGK